MALTGLSGYTRSNSKNVGGLYIIGLVEKEAFTAATLDATSEAYSAITLASSKFFKKYEFMEDEAEFKETSKFENNALTVTKEIDFKIPNMDAASRKAVQEIADASYGGMVAVVITPAKVAYVVGYGEDYKAERPLRLSQSDGTTGKKVSDPRGETVKLTCVHTEKSRIYSGETSKLFAA